MAGGMNNRRGERLTLADRQVSSVAQPPAPESNPPTVKHCWVTGPHGRLPGLLLAGEQRVDGWHGRVAHPVLEADGWVVVEGWLPAALLDPV